MRTGMTTGLLCTTYRTGKSTHKHSPMRVASDLKAHSVRSGTEGGKCTEKPDAGIVANESYGIGCKGQGSS